LQSLLVQAAWRISRAKEPATDNLRAWAQAIARRRGKKVAMVALARRLARTLFAMWRDQTAYQACRTRRRPQCSSSTMIVDTGGAAMV
jgi:hypothetical protein